MISMKKDRNQTVKGKQVKDLMEMLSKVIKFAMENVNFSNTGLEQFHFIRLNDIKFFDQSMTAIDFDWDLMEELI